MNYDSTQATLDHISQVADRIWIVILELSRRAANHDLAKLEEPEKSLFDEVTWKLKKLEYGSPEYKASLERLKPALDHHYALYRHHPEHFENGIRDMNLVDIVEMFCDWAAAVKRSEKGDLGKSIDINQKRFDIGDDLTQIFRNTMDVIK